MEGEGWGVEGEGVVWSEGPGLDITCFCSCCTLPSFTDSGWTPDGLHKSIWTPSGVQLKKTSTNNLFKIHLESMWTPPGIQVVSR